jgi:hypothetical protein
MNGGELFLGGMAVFALMTIAIKAQSGARRARAAADIARVGTSAVSLLGRVVATALVIVGVQWLVITHSTPRSALFWVVLGVPALVAGYTLTRACTITTLTHGGG